MTVARHGSRSRAGTKTFVSKPDLVSTTLSYPVTMTTGTGTGDAFTLTFNEFVDIAQIGFEVQGAGSPGAGNTFFAVGPAGGPKMGAAISRWRCANSSGGSYVALCGDNANGIPYIELPDGTSSQGLRIFAGTGAPAAGTVGQASAGLHRVGDFYFRQRSAGSTQVLYVCTVEGTGSGAGTWVQVI
jgi:hypothetical protein